MSSDKETGSYYTPYDTIQFMMDFLKKEQQDFSSVLEPSAGDGRFLSLLQENAEHITAVELFEKKVMQIKEKYAKNNIVVMQRNFLDFALDKQTQYSLIIGNPPYINMKLMADEDIQKARTLCSIQGLSVSAMQNMWLAFVVGACNLLQPGGSIFFVLPMEFLQVQYAEKLREHLESIFNTIHIVVFRKRVFPNIEQEICLVYLTNRSNEKEHIRYEVYEDAGQRTPVQCNIIRRNKPLAKWSNAILNDEAISLLKEAEIRYPKIKVMGKIAPGIVTGGNSCFILSEKQVCVYKCKDYVIPIVQKASYIAENTIEISDAVVQKIQKAGKPSYLLKLSQEKDIHKLPAELRDYLRKAGEAKTNGVRLKERYKCANRTPWYGVPIVKKGSVIFFKRYGNLPRVYINTADVHTTDAGYHIRLQEDLDAESLVFCFFNSMTLAQCEFNGRYYGGGVCELVPAEFQNLSVPYRKISPRDVATLKTMFNKNDTVENIVAFVNERTICQDYTEEQIQEFEEIRRILMGRRICD